MVIGDAGAAMIVFLPSLCVPARRGHGRMNTELYEVHSLEYNDIVLVNGMTYEIIDIAGEEMYDLIVVDEEGYKKVITCKGTDKINVVILDNNQDI